MGVTRASETAITKVYLRKKREELEVIPFEEHIEEEGAIKKNHTSAIPPAAGECLVHSTRFHSWEVCYAKTKD